MTNTHNNFSFSGQNKRDSMDHFLDFNANLLLKNNACNISDCSIIEYNIPSEIKILVRSNTVDSTAFKNKRYGAFMKGYTEEKPKKKNSIFSKFKFFN